MKSLVLLLTSALPHLSWGQGVKFGDSGSNTDVDQMYENTWNEITEGNKQNYIFSILFLGLFLVSPAPAQETSL